MNPLSPWLYLRRQPRRVLPVLAIQALVAALLVTILTPTNAFRATSESWASTLDRVTIVSPLRSAEFDQELLARLDGNEAQAERYEAKLFWFEMPMIVGQGFAPLVAVPEAHREELLQRLGLRLVEGTLPKEGSAECALHSSLLAGRKLAIGSAFGRLENPTDTTPGRFVVSGRLEGDSRLGIVDHAYASFAGSVLTRTPPFQLVYAAPGRKAESDAALRALADEDGRALLHVVDAKYVRTRIDDDLANLPLILGFITGSVAIVVALVTALLVLVSFQTRVDEFALHLAIGHPRRTLLTKLGVETALVAGMGWALGLALGTATVLLYRSAVLEPKGIVMIVPDPLPVGLSLLVPVAGTLVAVATLARRLARMDPVLVLQRRGG